MEEQLSDLVKDKAKIEARVITTTTELEVSSDGVIVVMV